MIVDAGFRRQYVILLHAVETAVSDLEIINDNGRAREIAIQTLKNALDRCEDIINAHAS